MANTTKKSSSDQGQAARSEKNKQNRIRRQYKGGGDKIGLKKHLANNRLRRIARILKVGVGADKSQRLLERQKELNSCLENNFGV